MHAAAAACHKHGGVRPATRPSEAPASVCKLSRRCVGAGEPANTGHVKLQVNVKLHLDVKLKKLTSTFALQGKGRWKGRGQGRAGQRRQGGHYGQHLQDHQDDQGEESGACYCVQLQPEVKLSCMCLSAPHLSTAQSVQSTAWPYNGNICMPCGSLCASRVQLWLNGIALADPSWLLLTVRSA